ncbi:hypothetical protein D7004_00505 [Pedobacter jejuensis]|uniref:Uncharacterized protein n=1 Tax=Pedobacter jejuensis TaxID=1268550 RepID=A0A3N0C3R7_9SPHI|nr:hypothetical protein D7004_00505 [Pedobacter jejuensis]
MDILIQFKIILEMKIQCFWRFAVLLYIPSPMKNWGFSFQSGLQTEDCAPCNPLKWNISFAI